MEIIDKTETERLKAFLGLGDFQTQSFVQQQSERGSHRDGDSQRN